MSMTVRVKIGIALVLIIVVGLSFLLLYLPNYWLRQFNISSVMVDDHPVQAYAYIGKPTDNEADAFLLVKIQGVGSFLFNFDEERFREVSSREFVQLYRGAFTFKPMSNGPWFAPLPSRNVNEFRVVSSNGHTIIVRL
jgi:hypothetical protein